MKTIMVKTWRITRRCTDFLERRQSKDEPPLLQTAITTTSSAADRKRTSTTSSAASVAVSRFRSVVTAAALLPSQHNRKGSTGSRVNVTGTLYGCRRGQVHLAFQLDPSTSCPFVLLDLTIQTSYLIHEMASGLVRIALECEHKVKEPYGLLEERIWRAYCNGKKCGYATRRECRTEDRKVLEAVGPVSMGAGVLPEGETMYLRSRFERVVGSRDSEAFYMMNHEGKKGTELSIYFLRV